MKHIRYIKHFAQILTVLTIVTTFPACDFESEGVYVDDTFEPAQLLDYYVDEYGNEGIVAYSMNSSSSEYQIVMSADETYLPWGPMGEQVYDADTMKGTNLGSHEYGVAMLQTMKSRGIERYPAQAWCNHKNHSEKYPQGGSWHLPTYHELVIIFGNGGANVKKINAALQSIGGTPLTSDALYWSCTEDYDGYAKINNVTSDYNSQDRAVVSTPSRTTTSTKERWLKKNSHYVRAIKYIYYEDL